VEVVAPLAVGVLASGSGSNLQALLDAAAEGRLAARIAVVVVNVPGARALDRARAAGVPAVLVPHRDYASREAFEAAVEGALRDHGVELVVLAGFMRLLSGGFVRRWWGKLVNVHPALLPSFPGTHGARQALDAGVRITGCTVHLVDEGTDTGPVLAQAAVPVLPGDTEATLQARIQVQEHRLLPWVVDLFARGRVKLEGRKVVLDVPPSPEPSSVLLSPEPAR
jgi:phosphoribosylglycinamide formyltransferase-1